MPDDDPYATISRGGLKLKGAKPTGVEKKKKKKKKKQPTTESSSSKALTKVLSDEDGKAKDDAEEELDEEKLKDLEDRGSDGKTAAERAAEEMRRKRLEQRLLSSGSVKTHKQRVEELNKYLSNLSEHHDMPRIGPG